MQVQKGTLIFVLFKTVIIFIMGDIGILKFENSKYIYDMGKALSRIKMMSKYNRNISNKGEALALIIKNAKDKVREINGQNECKKLMFINNNLQQYWKGAVEYVTEEEIKEFTLVYEINDGSVKFNKSDIGKLAKLFQMREGLDWSMAMYHSWWWARYYHDIAVWDGEFPHPKKHHIRISLTKVDAEDRRKRNEHPEDVKYYNNIVIPKLRYKKAFRQLIDDTGDQMPKHISKHWHCNIGVKFNHLTKGDCEIISHKKLKSGWHVEYVVSIGIKAGRKFKEPVDSFRNQTCCGNWKIITVDPWLIKHDTTPIMGNNFKYRNTTTEERNGFKMSNSYVVDDLIM